MIYACLHCMYANKHAGIPLSVAFLARSEPRETMPADTGQRSANLEPDQAAQAEARPEPQPAA